MRRERMRRERMRAGPIDDGPPERTVARLRPHGRALVRPAVLLVLVAGGAGWAVDRVDVSALPVVGDAVSSRTLSAAVNGAIVVVAVVLLLLGVVLPLVRWAGSRYTITTRRVVIRSGVLLQHRTEVSHRRGYDVSVRRSPAQRIVGSGDVLLHTARWSGDAGEPADAGVLVLRDVPRPGLVADALEELLGSATQRGPATTGTGRVPWPPGASGAPGS